MEIELHVPEPYDFLGCVRGHGWIALDPFAPTERGFARVERLSSGRVVLVDVSAEPADARVVVRGRAHGRLAAAEVEEVRSKIRWMLRLDEDLSEFYRLCAERRDGYMTAVGRGRLLRSPTLFEDAFKVILTTNTTWTQTKLMVRRTVQALGVPWPDDPSRRSFPTPDAILAAGERFFREEARLGYRVRAVLELAERADELERLKEEPLPTVELRRRLLSYRGIGPYGAATLLTLLGRYDDLAIDSEMRAFAARKYFGGRKPTDAEIRALYASWGRWKSLGYWLDSLD